MCLRVFLNLSTRTWSSGGEPCIKWREYPGGNQGYRPQSVDFACRISQHSIQHPCLLHYIINVIFILLDYEAIAEGWLHLLPNKYRTFASNLVHDVQDGMNRYFRGQALVAFCVGILFSIGFLIIDFPMAIALGLFIGALNMVPYLQIIGSFPPFYWQSSKLPTPDRTSGLSLHVH